MQIKRGPLWQWNENSLAMGIYEINSVDNLGRELEKKWGIGKLRLLAPPELREKFDRQRAKLNDALFEGDLDNLVKQCKRMRLAWQTLDRVAQEGGASHHPDVWEIAMRDGSVVALVRGDDEMTRANERALKVAAGRKLAIWSLEEVARLIEQFGDAARPVADLKARFHGAILESLAVHAAADDGAADDPEPFNDPLPF
jgi:hypothetical protein